VRSFIVWRIEQCIRLKACCSCLTRLGLSSPTACWVAPHSTWKRWRAPFRPTGSTSGQHLAGEQGSHAAWPVLPYALLRRRSFISHAQCQAWVGDPTTHAARPVLLLLAGNTQLPFVIALKGTGILQVPGNSPTWTANSTGRDGLRLVISSGSASPSSLCNSPRPSSPVAVLKPLEGHCPCHSRRTRAGGE
jgi:hypothetical protein